MSTIAKIVNKELEQTEGLIRQNPETGNIVFGGFVNQYTNRVFGAPFQLMDQVDMRIEDVNSSLGYQYMKNIMLNSPILYIKPGMPKYTGGDNNTGLVSMIKGLYWDKNSNNSNALNLLRELAKNTIFGKGSKLQRRMFGFRETYYDYMQHVNYMCRSVAIFLGLTASENTKYPHGTFLGEEENNMSDFSDIKWENYRMLRTSSVLTPCQYLKHLLDGAANDIASLFGAGSTATAYYLGAYTNDSTIDNSLGTTFLGNMAQQAKEIWSKKSIANGLRNKISTVQFMVEMSTYNETLSNEVGPSAIANAIQAVSDEIGSEIGFITNSNADTGIIGSVIGFLGDAGEGITTKISQLCEGLTGGFMTNLFSGAIGSLKGQKMIYPKIYKSSTSSGMNSEYTVTLTTPYGDIYNYFMNIIVPLLHLIALASPRLVTANTTASPYLVQSWIPGQTTCHLGIIKEMIISKNPNGKRVSVNGFPLEVKVTFIIEDLYNSMTISPANDPASFLFNETLNDYLANISGLFPSIDTYTQQRKVMFKNLDNYLSSGEWLNDMVSGIVEDIEDFINPFAGR